MTVTAINPKPAKPTPDVPVLVPEGKDATDLTMGELDVASVHLRADVLDCIRGEVEGKRYAAFIELAYLWAKRRDPKAKRDTYRDHTAEEIFHALRMDEDDQEADAESDPTGSGDEPNESP